MNFLFLRGQEPKDRNPKETYFDKIEQCDDVWTQLASAIVGDSDDDKCVVLYWGGNRYQTMSKNLIEIRTPTFKNYSFIEQFKPDVIFARGGFKEYHHILKNCPKAFKIYYGAGRRHMPQPGFEDYQLILVDSLKQQYECRIKYPNISCHLFLKPAPENILEQRTIKGTIRYNDSNKPYDVCFPANGSQKAFKGHSFVYTTLPSNLRLLNLGNISGLSVPSNVVSQRVLRKDISKYYSMCKMGIVCCEKGIDSCPRVIPEMLYCNLPIVILRWLNFWEAKYITPETGILSSKDAFWDNVQYVLDHLQYYKPREHYLNNLTLKHSADLIRSFIYRS